MAVDVNNAESVIGYLNQQLGLHTPQGQAPDSALVQFVTDELDAHHGSTSGFDGFQFSDVVSTKDFMNLIKLAETQAAVTGYQHFPTAKQLVAMAKNPPPDGWDQASASAAMFQLLPPEVQQKFPGAQFGMTHETYVSTLGQYMDSWENITGDRVVDMNLMNQAITEGWSQSRLTQFLMGNSWMNNDKAPWTKFNMNHQQWTQHKIDAKQAIIGRYGAAMANNDQAYLADLTNPLQKISAADAGNPASTKNQYVQQAGVQTHESSVR